MLRLALITGALILSVSCGKSESGGGVGSAASPAGSAAKPGTGPRPAASFSADLAKELGAGSAAKPRSDAPKTSAEASGSNTVAAISSGGVKPGAQPALGAKAAGADGANAGPGGKGGGSGSAGPGGKGGGSGKAGSNASAPVANVRPGPSQNERSDAPTGSTERGELAPRGSGAPTRPEVRGPLKTPSELAAIKLSLLPNWDRDIDEAGTFQYVVRIKGTQSTKTFSFRYGYDDPKAPADRDQYKKYLQDSKLLVGEIKDRQRGAAWYLEGTDASGLPAFRYVVLYGGKRLICYGSQYKDADSNRLGDDRDQTLIQAKQICETLAL